jgi:DNA-binding transcriptional ArsR family regulator
MLAGTEKVAQEGEGAECFGEEHAGGAVPPGPPPDAEALVRTAAIFRALGDERRLCLLLLLAHREMCVSELTERLKDNLPAISQRLKLLRAERIVVARRHGKHVFYTLADEHIAQLIANGLAHGSEKDRT